MKNQLTTIIHTHNEEKYIADCIRSARQLTENIIVIDMQSADRTLSIVSEMNIPFFTFPYSRYVEPARQFGIEKVNSEWVFILDVDERINPKLAAEIHLAIKNKTITHFKIPRKNIFSQTKWLQHGGWYPDYVTRLIKIKAFKNWPAQIHSTPIIDGDEGVLHIPLLHYFHPNLEDMVKKTAVYEDIEAELLCKAGRKVSTIIFFRKYFGELFRRLVKHFGFRDGTIGIIESFYQAYSKTITYLFLYEKKQKSRTI